LRVDQARVLEDRPELGPPRGPGPRPSRLYADSQRLGYRLLGLRFMLELRLLGRAHQGQRGGLAAGDRLRDEVEVAGADLALMARGGIALLLELELVLLHADVGGHALPCVALGQRE